MGSRAGPRSSRKPWFRYLITAGLAAGVAAPAHAGAWPQKKGEGLTIVTTLADRADRARGDDRQIVEDGYFYKDEVSLYAEYGVSQRLTAIARVAWQDVRRRDGPDFDSATGLSASEVGLRWAVRQDANAVYSLQATALIPGQGENVSNRPLGDGGQAWEVRALWGHAFGETVFTDAQLAYRWRDAENLDELRLDATFGWRPRENWLLLGQAFAVTSAEAGRAGRADFDQLKLQISAGRQLGAVEYHIGAFVTPTGRNTIEERAVFLSVWRRF